LEKLIANIKTVTEKIFPSKLATSGITYQQANVLRTIELLNFFSQYTLSLAAYYIAHEVSKTAGGDNWLTKAEEAYISENWIGYNTAAGFILDIAQGSDFEKMIKAIPEVVASAGATGLSIDYSPNQGRLDPTRRGFIALKYNPFAYYQKWM